MAIKPNKNLITAVMAMFVLLWLAVYREKVPLDYQRDMLVELFKFGTLMLFGIFLVAKIDLYAALLLVIGFVSFLYPVKTNHSIKAFLLLTYGVGFYAALLLLFQDHSKYIGYCLCVIAAIHLVVVLNGGHLMTNPNEESALFALCLSSFLLFRGYWKFLVLISLVGVFKIQSFNGILASVTVLCIYGIYRMPHIWYGFLYVFAIGGLLYWDQMASETTMQRLGWWTQALKGWWEHPNGCGIGNWKVLSGYLVSAGKIQNGCRRLHNTWVEGLVEMGTAFGGCVIVYTIYTIKRLRNVHIAHILGIVAFLIVSSTNSLFRMNIINGMIAISLLARLELEIRSQREPQR